ncbi:MAG TPA: hypothetical protein VE544_08185 [Nitrososphaeraceae archaeon]|nr:hypothetical protein [Nitrososphaeraceae archaeon]
MKSISEGVNMVTSNNTTKSLVKQSLIQKLGSILASLKLVFSHWTYITLAGTIAAIFWIIFNVFEQLLFFYPIIIFYLPEDAILGFILSSTTASILGTVVSMNVYVLKHSRDIRLMSATSFFSGSSIGILSSTCASCTSLGFLLASTLGGAGLTLSTILSNYQTPLRILSIILLIWAFYSVSIRLNKGCKMVNSK